MDVDATDRTLLQSSKPSLFASVDCNALVAAVVSRQISVLRLLLMVVILRASLHIKIYYLLCNP